MGSAGNKIKLLKNINKYEMPAITRSTFVFCALAAAAATTSLQSCLTLCNPIDGSPPGSSVPGILQTRTLEWVASSFSYAFLLPLEEKIVTAHQL